MPPLPRSKVTGVAALLLLVGCGAEEPDGDSSLMFPSEREPLADPKAILAALAKGGVQVPELDVQHVGQDGTVYRFDVRAPDAVPTWERVRRLANEIGYYPVVCQEENGELIELQKINKDRPSDVLRSAAGIKGAEWFGKRAVADRDYYDDVDQGEWETVEPQAGWSVPFDVLTGEPAPGVWIALVPTTTPWKVLAYLHYGGWNECPGAEEHVAVHRYWHEHFGAEIVCLAGDVVEMRVARPPTDREAALALAREQFIYSGGDLIYQGYGSMRRLAATLVGAKYWYFWWD